MCILSAHLHSLEDSNLRLSEPKSDVLPLDERSILKLPPAPDFYWSVFVFLFSFILKPRQAVSVFQPQILNKNSLKGHDAVRNLGIEPNYSRFSVWRLNQLSYFRITERSALTHNGLTFIRHTFYRTGTERTHRF